MFQKEVSKIKIKSLLSILLSKFIMKVSKMLFKGGSSFPGKVALRLDKHILAEVSKGYKTILITGTNGKTTTTSMIYNILKQANKSVITNGTGANMDSGIVSCFISNYKFTKTATERFAVIEVDEAYLQLITEDLKPSIIAVTNLFRDQLDRYGEVYTTYSKIIEGINKTPESTLVLNGDESLLGNLNLPNPLSYFGFMTSINESNAPSMNSDSKFCKVCKSPYSYDYITYNHLGSFFCNKCGYKRPKLKYFVDSVRELTPEGSVITFNGNEYFISQSGEYNIYNGLCAYAIAKELHLDDSVVKASLKNQNSSFGRQESVFIGDKEVIIILVKNPAGYNQALKTILLNKDKVNISVLLNDNYADGTDVSWIWDVDFEKMNSLEIEDIIIGGTRLYDMAVRLKTAGFSPDKFILCEDDASLIDGLVNSSNSTTYILTTYTAMLHLRKLLHSKGYIKIIW